MLGMMIFILGYSHNTQLIVSKKLFNAFFRIQMNMYEMIQLNY